MTTWPVNYIEQDQVYRRLLAEYETRLAQATPVLIQSFREPTQEEWEDAYVRQTNRVPPILPGKLRWMDMRNGTVKSYTTIYKDGGVDIDPVVRPISDRNDSWGCIRLLGVSHIVNDVGLPYDVTTLINKGLLMFILHAGAVRDGFYIDNGNNADVSGYQWQGASATRVGAAAASTDWSSNTRNWQIMYLMNPVTERVDDELVFRGSTTSSFSTAMSPAGTMVLSVGQGRSQPGKDIEAMFPPGDYHIYGVFSSDPGYIEEFEIV